ncbi:Eco57I restriction-modification methylase domain-containing protein [Leuconostoc pseudomesenteroides]|uniref:Eco57I restriction-modification methylase domain-containing protein n=1 Tax=Leuconostoc pseudomesenteroides TaxID=33968 RepID=UPI0032DFF42C
MNGRYEQNFNKLRGGFYTPSEIASYLAEWVLDAKPESILEPSAGDGAFIAALTRQHSNFDIDAVELIEGEADKISKKFSKFKNLKVFNADFFDFYTTNEKKYDAIIGNPPYIRYQFLTDKQRNLQSKILIQNGLKSNKLINAWVAFTVAGLNMLKSGGRMAFVIPTDFLQVSYAHDLRRYLLTQFSELTIVTFEHLIFKDIQQDVVLLFGIKNGNAADSSEIANIRVITVQDKKKLKKFDNVHFISNKNKLMSDKWTELLLPEQDRNYLFNIMNQHYVTAFSSLAKGEVGVTTGNNSFFSLNRFTIAKYDLQEYVKPLLGRSINADGVLFSECDLNISDNEGKNNWLLSLTDHKYEDFNDGLKNYLKQGVQDGQNVGYKLSIRDEWYKIPSVWEPDAFMLRRIGRFPKLLFNGAKAVSTDTFHRIVFFEGVNKSALLFSFYSSLTLTSIELAGRNFGGGALELLPGDLTKVYIPKTSNPEIIFDKLVDELNKKLRNGVEDEHIVQWVDQELIKHGSTIDFDRTQKMWKFLRNRRINR